MNFRTNFIGAAALGLVLQVVPAHAVPIVFTGSGTAAGVSASASATFAFTGNTLTITLQNTSADNAGQDVPGSTLSGLFFDLDGGGTLTPGSATIAAGSIVQGAQCSTGLCTATLTDVGGEFGFQQGGSFPGGADYGISSSGYLTTGLPGNIGNFNGGGAGTNLDDPNSLDGINFGIISDDPTFNPNGGLANDPLIRDTVTFVLSGVTGLDETDIDNVSFQYGTSLTEANIPGTSLTPTPTTSVPEPTTMALLGSGLLVAGGFARRRRLGK